MSDIGGLGDAFVEIKIAILRTEKAAAIIRANLVPSVAKALPWSKMEFGQDNYRDAARAILSEPNL